MARVRRSEKARSTGKDLTVPHRERLIVELRANPMLATEYLNAAAEDDDPRVYLMALRTVVEAEGMAKVAKAARVPRESLYRALSAVGNPRLSTFRAILKAAGFKLVVVARSERDIAGGVTPYAALMELTKNLTGSGNSRSSQNVSQRVKRELRAKHRR
jgi:probable addiction module antidote protein